MLVVLNVDVEHGALRTDWFYIQEQNTEVMSVETYIFMYVNYQADNSSDTRGKSDE